MRTIKELLEVMRDNVQLFEGGLCVWVVVLHNDGIISVSERNKLRAYILESDTGMRWGETGYWWEPDELSPRLLWLNEQIKKLEKEG